MNVINAQAIIVCIVPHAGGQHSSADVILSWVSQESNPHENQGMTVQVTWEMLERVLAVVSEAVMLGSY